MNNHYHGTNPALTDKEQLYGRESVFRSLDDHVRNRRNVVIMGVEGVGKSSLLNCYFSAEYRRKIAREQHLLIRITDFPTDRDSDGVYQYLAEGVLRAVDSLDQEETAAAYELLRKKCIREIDESRDAAARFQAVCERIQEEGYNIMLVIDGFERFVSSSHVKMEHHDLMNSLIAKNLSFVVATNYDFNQDSLPKSVSGSFLLMKFSGNAIRLKGLSEKDCAELVVPGDFSGEELHQMWILSGGIPALFRKAAEHTYAHKQNGSIVWKEVLKTTYDDVSPLLAQWCKLLSANQVAVLKLLVESESKSGVPIVGDLEVTAQELVDRGLLANPIESGTLRIIPGLYKFNSPLLREYCKKNDLQVQPISLEETPAGISNEELVAAYESWAREHGFTPPISYADPISDELLAHYHLSRESLGRYDESVQKLIRSGIIADQTLMQAPIDDKTPQFNEFAKALEVHLNHTVLPVLRLIAPEFVLRSNSSGMMVTVGTAESIMLGQFEFILNFQSRFMPFVARAGQYCRDQGLTEFKQNWWETIRQEMSDIGPLPTERVSVAELRNKTFHKELMTEEQGKAFLRTIFKGKRSLFDRCQDLYEEAARKKLI